VTHVLTLIAARADGLDETVIDRVCDALPHACQANWLSPGEACDIHFDTNDETFNAHVRNTVHAAVGDALIDIVFQPIENRRKRLLIADMDSTLIGQECIDELADFAGLKPKIAAITERAMRGEIEFEPALRERVALLKGLDESVLDIVFDEHITLNPGARALARTMSSDGAATVIVSGGFTFFTARVAEAAGFETDQANILEISAGKLTGRVTEPILGQQAKLDALRHFRETLGLSVAQTLAVGDGANDLAMLREAGLGVAYHAKPVVAEKAHARIEHGNLTALLFAQGYNREEFVED